MQTIEIQPITAELEEVTLFPELSMGILQLEWDNFVNELEFE
jgi:hypothetical protein